MSSTECFEETGFDYQGYDINNGFNDSQSNAEDCRHKCRSRNATFFTWVPPMEIWENYQNSCWCKTSNAGRRAKAGHVSGNVNCSMGKLHLANYDLIYDIKSCDFIALDTLTMETTPAATTTTTSATTPMTTATPTPPGAAAGWRLSPTAGWSCDQVCSALGLSCSESQQHEHNADVSSSTGMQGPNSIEKF